jgi:hypothetical protein
MTVIATDRTAFRTLARSAANASKSGLSLASNMRWISSRITVIGRSCGYFRESSSVTAFPLASPRSTSFVRKSFRRPASSSSH